MDCHKFRIWNATKKEYLKLNNKQWANIGSDGELIIGYEDTIDEEIQEENELIVEWSTGLPDKTGKRLIYEGDTVLLLGTHYNIIWNPIHCQYLAIIGQSWYMRDSHEITSDMEVIGNVHDHIVHVNKKAVNNE